MPLYEYRCNACSAKVSMFVRSINADANATCDRCGSTDMRRLISRVAVLHAPVDPTKLNKAELLDGVDYSDPASMAQFFRRVGETFQDESNEHMDEIIGRLDHGESVGQTLGLDDHSGHDHGPPPLSPGGEGE